MFVLKPPTNRYPMSPPFTEAHIDSGGFYLWLFACQWRETDVSKKKWHKPQDKTANDNFRLSSYI
ncbi:hypothetical protein EMPG_17758 [Blastomyces silverae]|uniref:Uncharacterized protein n=1 Tax=Blastomyces silverae TaxID=2060906 RepID=A0A0H1B6W6_9EURO|nr:hypothetical protein EMPG_17758 [Blastomyces silverae]